MKIKDIVENKNKQELPPSKPRNYVAKNMGAATSGAGAHRDKKKEMKQGKEKHKNKQYDVAEGYPVNAYALMSRGDHSGSGGPWWAKAGDINHMSPSGKIKPMRYKLYFKNMFAQGMEPNEVKHHAQQLGMERDEHNKYYLPVYTLNDKTKAAITRARFYFGDDTYKVTINNDKISEEGDEVAGTITSVTPDGKQVTMKKPDGTEITTDASAFLPGPNNTVTINQPSPGDALKPGTVVQAQQPVGEEINDEDDPDLMGSGHNLHVGGDATDDFIDDVRDQEFEKANRGVVLNRLKHLAGLK